MTTIAKCEELERSALAVRVLNSQTRTFHRNSPHQQSWPQLACRNVELGRAAANDLVENSSCACDAVALPIPLDLADPKSIAAAAKWVEEEYDNNNDNGQQGGGGGAILDVLVNNAAVHFNDPPLYGRVEYTPFEWQADVTVKTNYFGMLDATRSFLPLLKRPPSPRIINVASAAGRLTILRSQTLVDAFTSEELTMPELSKLTTQFVKDANDGTHAEQGWPNTCYGLSKVGVIAMPWVLARQHPEMMINSVDPGYCKTDQNNDQGVVDPANGAYTPYLLAQMERENEGGGGVEGENECRQ